MAKHALTANQWNSIGTLTVKTAVKAAGGALWLFAGSTSGKNQDDGLLLAEGEMLVIDAGISLSAYPETNNPTYLHTLSIASGL